MKKSITVLLAAVLALGAFAGCNKRKVDSSDPQTLEVYLYNAGYGEDWCQDLLDAFAEEDWVKAKYPNLEIDFDSDETANRAQELLAASERANRFDLVMGTGLESLLDPDAQAIDLTEVVYNSEVPGEGVLFKDKMLASYLESAAYKGRAGSQEETAYYQVNWASGMTGIMYNATKLAALTEDGTLKEGEKKLLPYDVPNTTDELIAVLRAVKDKNGQSANYTQTSSFATYGASSYAHYLYYIWWAQYETSDEYINFYNGIDSATESRSPAIFLQDGLLEALSVLETIYYRDNGYVWINPNTGREAYRETQNRVQLGNALFMANGDWADNELATLREGLIEQNGSADEIKLMRTPVISSIIDHTPSIPDDKTLSAVVNAIDKGETSYGSVDPEDFAIVKAAREVVYSIGPGHNAFIPSYAAGKEVAIDFLRFMATDKAQEIYIRSTNGASLPFKYDLKAKNEALYNEISPMQQDRIDYFAEMEVNVLPSQASFPLVRYGGLSLMASGNPLEDFTEAHSKEQYSSVAEMAHQREYKYWSSEGNANFNNCLSQAGY